MIFRLLISIAVFHFAHGISLSCVPGMPEYQSSMTCTCTNPTKNGVEWRRNSQIVTTCSGTVDDCFPLSLEYTSSVSGDKFYWEVSQYSYTDCATYSCKDPSTGEEVSATTSIADFGQSSITAHEPGANIDGQIKVITGCVFPTSDITVTWYKIENGNVEDFTASRPSPIQSSDRSNCSRTCNTETDKKVESGFTHTEYPGSDYVEVRYRVTVTHKSYIDEGFTWTSSKYRLKAGTTPHPSITPSTTSNVQGCKGNCKVRVIVSIAFGNFGIIALFVVIYGFAKGSLNMPVSLTVDVAGFVFDIISLGLSASVLADDNCNDCEDWILNSAIAFVVIPSVFAVAATGVVFLICCGVIKPELHGTPRTFMLSF